MKTLTEEQLKWIIDNEKTFTLNNATSLELRTQVYELYNWMRQTNKKPNSCGRCWTNTKKEVYDQFKKQTKIF